MMNREALTKQLIYLMQYALSSLLAVALDFGIYAALSYNGLLPPGLANAVSAPAGFFVGWFIAGKTIFHRYGIKSRGYMVWFVFLILTIPVYSVMLQSIVWLGFDKYIAKIFMLGASFSINSFCFKYVILKKFSGSSSL